MIEQDFYGRPVLRRVSGYPVTIDGVRCTASEHGPPDARLWKIRNEKGRVLGVGRTVTKAVRVARLVLRGERP